MSKREINLMFAVAWGYVPILRFGLEGWARMTFGGVFLLALSIFLSLSYWDISQVLLGKYWPDVRDWLGGQRISTVRNTAVIAAGVLLLHGRLHLIPASERHGWHWWNAWLHPCERCRIVRKPKVK
jgi:hypothetical protein